jgi:hypothetical protein
MQRRDAVILKADEVYLVRTGERNIKCKDAGIDAIPRQGLIAQSGCRFHAVPSRVELTAALS